MCRRNEPEQHIRPAGVYFSKCKPLNNPMMLSKRKVLVILLLFFTFLTNLFAQQGLPIATNFNSAYAEHTRDTSGSPGKNYWQNSADYKIKVSFNPETRSVTGEVDVFYQNNSPDTLDKIVFKLYPNLFQQQAMRNKEIAPSDLTDGVHIKSFRIDNKPIDDHNLKIRGTNMFLINTQLLPGKHSQIKIQFDYLLNKNSFIRTGQVDSGAFVIAYFFPRISVYDDIDGWNEYPYLGKEEFYNDFSNFNVEITIPGSYQCWATGDLINTDEVYEREFVQRILRASTMDGITDIITASDIQDGQITKSNPTNTWKFEAKNVIDFAFTMSNHFVWRASSVQVDATTGRRTQVDAVYNPHHKAFVPVINYARKTVELISYKIPGIPFPYSHQTIFEGLDGTEYPMMVNNFPYEDRLAVEFTVHEIFHALLPFYVGSNETKYSFLDEGWATFAEFSIAPLIEPTLEGTYDISSLNTSAGSDQDVAIMTLTPQLYGKARFSNKDLKPALGFHYIREMVGDSLFFKGLRYFLDQWEGKHPTPYDFFYCMNTGIGRNLNWFWKNWYFERSVPDLAITNVDRRGKKYNIEVSNVGTAIVPIHLFIHYKDRSIQTLDFNIACWKNGNKKTVASFKTSKDVDKIVLGKPYDGDVNTRNNIWIGQ